MFGEAVEERRIVLSEMQEDRSACVKHTHDMSARRGARVAGEKWSRDDFADGVCVSREIMQKPDRYLTLVQEWNPRASLVSKAGMEDPWRRHRMTPAALVALLRYVRRGGGGKENRVA